MNNGIQIRGPGFPRAVAKRLAYRLRTAAAVLRLMTGRNPTVRTSLPPLADTDSPAFWDRLFQTPSTAYCNDLAKLAGHFSELSETNDGGDIAARYRTYGFSPDHIAVGNYKRIPPDIPDVGSGRVSLAFAIGHRPIAVWGEPAVLLVITARGSVNLWELYRDLTTEAAPDSHGYPVYDLIAEFAEELRLGLCRYLTLHRELSRKKLRFLVTGHSLGGAAANLLAARLTAYAPGWADRGTVCCYTFGAIDVLDVSEAEEAPVLRGFENLHNLYNELDDFSPNGHGLCGVPLLMAKGCHRTGKFGRLHTFEADYIGRRTSTSPNHDMFVYLTALDQPENVRRWQE